MSKAILVMDMPNTCKDCNLCIASRETHTGHFCWKCVIYPTIMIDKAGIKPDYCPLVPLPEKKEVSKSTAWESKSYKSGWNACLDAIGGDNSE